MSRSITRRRLLKLGAAAAAAGYLGSSPSSRAVFGASAQGGAGGTGGRVLYRDASFADGRTASIRTHVSVFVDAGRVGWIRPADDEGDPGPVSGLEIVDARGLTIVPGMVDCHSHLTSPGGANYLDHFKDPPSKMLETAEENGRLAHRAGTAWLREVGSPTVVDPVDGRTRALALGIRDRWAGRADRPR